MEEIRRLSETMPQFKEIWLSGGEPTLRENLPEILELFYRQNGIRSINLPANGLLPAKLAKTVEDILSLCPQLRINLNLALDGIGATHDAIRGVPGNYERALESLSLLEELRGRSDQLRLHVNSVVCRKNVDEMIPLGELIRTRFRLDGHYFQIIRGEPMDPSLLEVHRERLEQLYQELRPLYRHYANRLSERKRGISSRISRISYLGALNLYHEIQANNFDRHHRWPMPCTAAETIAVVDANGDIRACELRETLGNLRDVDCDWQRFWLSRKRHEEIDSIRQDGCWCTHICFIHASLKASAKAIAWDVPRAYLGASGRSSTISHQKGAR